MSADTSCIMQRGRARLLLFCTLWCTRSIESTHHGVLLVDVAPVGAALVAGGAGDVGNGLAGVHLEVDKTSKTAVSNRSKRAMAMVWPAFHQ